MRWLKFNFVGGLGIAVQLAWLARLVSDLQVAPAGHGDRGRDRDPAQFRVARALHRKGRTGGEHGRVVRGGGAAVALSRGNGVISLAGNLVLMRPFVGTLHVKYLLANMIAIALCSLLNSAASEWFVFR